jgi:magnesium chelatase accessory protein
MSVPPRAWARDGAGWPNRDSSRFVEAGGLTWHVQVMGAGPPIFLAHGTGAATHSWRDLAQALAAHFSVVSADLPGHGFTSVPPWHGLSLPGMARDLHSLLTVLAIAPRLVVGHSAGAAILARMCLDKTISPAGLVSLNGAFIPFEGPAGAVFAPLARIMVGLPGLPQLFAWRAKNPAVLERLLSGTGSRIDPAGADFYARLIRNPDHAAAALRMMANWDLAPLLRDLPALAPALLLVAGETDRLIPPSDADRVQSLVPGAELIKLPGLGHLAHEESPAETAAIITGFARRLGVLPDT